ncbi:hypothetical protein MNV84_05849 [Leishmania braziliensis]|nr:hypothetical protein MNV84_05849 [Leishmania braziliensis]
MEGLPPPPPHEVHIDFFGIEGNTLHSPAPHDETPDGTAAAPPRAHSGEGRAALQRMRHSTPAVVPRSVAIHNDGNNTNSRPHAAIAKTRCSSACGAANGASPAGSRPSLTEMAASFPISVPMRDSIRHFHLLKSPHHSASNGSGAAAVNNEQVADESDAGGATGRRPGMLLYEPLPHTRRHQASRSERKCSAITTAQFPVNTAVFASPEHPEEAVAPVAGTQEDVRCHVHVVLERHMTMLAAWEKRVSVAEVYRDKPVRTGGRPAPVRPQDRSFLEHIRRRLDNYLQQLEDAKSLLIQACEEVPPAKSGRQGDVKEWQSCCSRFYHALSDFTIEESLMRFRVNKLLTVGQQEFTWRISARTTSSRGSSARASTRSRSRKASKSATTGQQPLSTGAGWHSCPAQSIHSAQSATATGAEASQLRIPTVTNGALSPYVRHLVSSGVVQRSNCAIKPGHGCITGPVQTGAVSEEQLCCPRPSGGCTPRRTTKSPTPSSAPALSQARQQQRLLSLHPDTVSQQPSRTSNRYGNQTPYGPLSPQRRTVSLRPVHSPTHPMVLLSALDDDAELRSATPSRSTLAVPSACLPTDAPLQLRTYSSPRGTATAKITPCAAALQPFRHRQLLEVIERCEKNTATLQRGDLHRVRACFCELYGEQVGLQQYCQWIDDIFIEALHEA